METEDDSMQQILSTNENSNPTTVSSNEVVKGQFNEQQIQQFLRVVGLVQPIDYIFLDYAMTRNRKEISNSKQPLHFLFHVVMGAEGEERAFPYCSFLELCNYKISNMQRYVIYNLSPSDSWKTRPVAPFTDFHLYFLDVLKPCINQSAEELYQIIDIKRGETFFLIFGDREKTEFLSVLFVTAKHIVVFHIYRPVPLDPCFDHPYICKWVDTEIPCVGSPQHEYAIFELPDSNLVLTEEGVKKRQVHWEEAFGNGDLMDQEDGQEMKVPERVNYEETECLSCGS